MKQDFPSRYSAKAMTNPDSEFPARRQIRLTPATIRAAKIRTIREIFSAQQRFNFGCEFICGG